MLARGVNPSHKIGLKHIPDRSLLSVPVVCFLPLPEPAVGPLDMISCGVQIFILQEGDNLSRLSPGEPP